MMWVKAMVDDHKQLICVELQDTIGFIEHVEMAPEHGELLFIGTRAAMVLDLAGNFLETHRYESAPAVAGPEPVAVAWQRTPAGWQFLHLEEGKLKNCALQPGNISDIPLEYADIEAHSAAWSPCGRFVAVGSPDTILSVWDTQCGELQWRSAVVLENVQDINKPRRHEVAGWSASGKEITSIVQGGLMWSTFIWDMETHDFVVAIDS